MASKLNQMSLGDSYLYQLDDDPRTTGFSAPLGSVAYVQNTFPTLSRLYFKIGSGNFSWSDMGCPWRYDAGTTLHTSVPFGVLGTALGDNKDLSLIRNGIEMIRLTTNPTPLPLDTNLLYLIGGKLALAHTTGQLSFNYNTSVFSNWFLALPANIYEYENIAIASQGYASTIGYRGVVRQTQDKNSQYAFSIYEFGNGAINQNYTGVALELDLDNMEFQKPFMGKIKLECMVRNTATNQVSQCDRTFTVKFTDYANGVYQVVNYQDDFTFAEDGVTFPNVQLSFANEASTATPLPLNTLKVKTSITGLTIGQVYDISVYSKRLGFEL